jgi:hypothetical protein
MFHSFNEETDAPKRSYKPRRKKRLKGLPNKVVVLKNIDKDVGNWVENWDTPKKRSPGCIIHPFRLLSGRFLKTGRFSGRFSKSGVLKTRFLVK